MAADAAAAVAAGCPHRQQKSSWRAWAPWTSACGGQALASQPQCGSLWGSKVMGVRIIASVSSRGLVNATEAEGSCEEHMRRCKINGRKTNSKINFSVKKRVRTGTTYPSGIYCPLWSVFAGPGAGQPLTDWAGRGTRLEHTTAAVAFIQGTGRK